MSAHVPYCGLPASPDRIWSAWNLNPLLLLLLAGMALLYSRLSDPVTAKERTCFHLGLCIAGAALVSPLCNLGVSLFSAREAQHMILALLAAPLLVTGHLGTVARPLSGRLAGG